MSGRAPPRPAFQLICWAASKGGVALVRRLLTLYPLPTVISSAAAAACFLLHAAAAGDVQMVHLALYHCGEAAAAAGFDCSVLATYPAGVGGEMPLHRAATCRDGGGVACALLATLSSPLDWFVAREGPLNLTPHETAVRAMKGMGVVDDTTTTTATLLHHAAAAGAGAAGGGGGDVPGDVHVPGGSRLVEDAVAAAMATAVRVSRCLPSATASSDIVDEAIAYSTSPAACAELRDSARAAVTLRLLSDVVSSEAILRIAKQYSCDTTSPDPDMDDVVSAALVRWPTLGARRSSIGGGGGGGGGGGLFCRLLRSTARSLAHLSGYGPDGSRGLIFCFTDDPALEAEWVKARAGAHLRTDIHALVVLLAIKCIAVIKRKQGGGFGMKGLLENSTSLPTATEDAIAPWMFAVFLRYMIYMFVIPTIISGILLPQWYIRHREKLICVLRIGSSFVPIHELGGIDGLLKKRLSYVVWNFFATFYPIRIDRHLCILAINGLLQVQQNSWLHSADDVPLRLMAVVMSIAVVVAVELQSRRAFLRKQGMVEAKGGGTCINEKQKRVKRETWQVLEEEKGGGE